MNAELVKALVTRGIVYALAALSVVILAVSLWHDFQPRTVTITKASVTVDGDERTYRLAVPTDLDLDQPIPVVFALHGALDTVDQMAQWTGLDEYAADSKAIVCYLQGRSLNWPPYIPPSNPEHADPDFEFFDKLLGQISAEYNIDQRRVYLVGVSQGGAMSLLFAARRTEKLAAVVNCCGWLPKPLDTELASEATERSSEAAELASLESDAGHKCQMLFIVGSEDEQVGVHHVEAAYEAFASAGYPSQFHLVDEFGHGWPDELGINEVVWNFLSQQTKADSR